MKLLPLVVSLSIVSVSSLSFGQATRTWISGVGDDANPCSRTSPGKTFAGAISKTAPGGVIDVLDPGGFGAVTITKAITLEGDAAEGSILVSGTHGIVIAAGTNDVIILRNLTFEGLGTGLSGIDIISAGAVHIENCRINGFTTNGISFYPDNPAQLFVKDTTIHNCGGAGISCGSSELLTAIIEHVNVTGCTNGIDAGTNTTATVTDTTASGNVGIGFLAEAGASMSISRGIANNNSVGVESSGQIILSASTVADNSADGLDPVKPGKIITVHNNLIFGNNPDGKASSILSAK